MRKVARLGLPAKTQKALDKKQQETNRRSAEGSLQVDAFWKNARNTLYIGKVLSTLKNMAGDRERCMYCSDSHGTDIEHFWPKAPYPERMFCWPNLLLCCTECGRFKGERFPMENGQPLLIDPTAENPWNFLDFDPATGNVMARFDVATNDWSKRGIETIKALQLDRREAMTEGYKRTFHRLAKVVEGSTPAPDEQRIALQLAEADDHGLLGWCFSDIGKRTPPFNNFSTTHPAIWGSLAQRFA